jgi:hypothetical protein
MNEELLQYIWMTGLFNGNGLKSTTGQDIIILKRGKLNTDSGPDFSHARIKIDDTEWVGHIEIHIDSDDWLKHRHHLDKSYNNTILHVVLQYKQEVYREDGTMVPCIDISDRIHQGIIDQYQELKSSNQWIACAGFLHRIDHFTINQVLDRVLIQRLERKTDMVKHWLEKSTGDWQSVFYLAITRSFGFGTNSEAFEQLAIHMPLNILSKHKHDTETLECLLFGVAGFLENEMDDPYYRSLREEWQFLQIKYGIRGMLPNSFKFMRMRPGNFPTVRIAQLAALLARNNQLLSKVIEEEDLVKVIQLFQVKASEYWRTHYVFGKTGKPHAVDLTPSAIQNILINAVVPVLFVYGQEHHNESLTTKAVNLLHQLPAEANHVITHWSRYGIHARTAFDSQALIELKKNNCDEKRCLECRIGNKVMGL